MPSIKETQEEIISDFGLFDDWMQKYEHIIDFGKSLPLINPEYKTEENLIKGCQSRVWLHAELRGDKVIFTADSDAIITKGLVGLMVQVLSGHTPDEIINADLYFLEKTGLKEHLSPTRANGLLAMIKQMKMYSVAFKSQLE